MPRLINKACSRALARTVNPEVYSDGVYRNIALPVHEFILTTMANLTVWVALTSRQ